MRSTVELFQASPSNDSRPPPARASTCAACATSCAATRVSAASWWAGLHQSAGEETPQRAPACCEAADKYCALPVSGLPACAAMALLMRYRAVCRYITLLSPSQVQFCTQQGGGRMCVCV
jgi:hypothetical protein